ncbi:MULTISPECIES: site-specific integrase [Pseudomonadaceae]|uniref:site-specific integrase n=1 Tax=Pseudomonadaceae TaxID=135621 RepID=UPI0007725D0C|nr:MULTISPECIES: site-specific integrase [Pseudomonas]KXF20797.1 integrase [Pseudomonas aeruginosa]KXF27278.1 integrase [Pseudomonas aeruginosa]KXF28302.1 integrase [Pseudomonas aeruginosa]WFS19579.1 site-specific integrase [Pseudomonas sp. 905_Psudmo1]
MKISVEALQAPTKDSLDAWLNTPRLAKCGKVFTPAEPMWKPDQSANHSVNWKAAVACVSLDWQPWLHAALAYRMADMAAGTVASAASGLSRAAQAGLDPLNEDHLIALRERFNHSEFSVIASFMAFWHDCESLEQRPSQPLIDAYQALPRKKRSSHDVILSLDPEQGPFTQVEQDGLYQWIHEQFCHGQLDCEQYLYLRILMIYGSRGTQVRAMVFGDFTKSDQGCMIRIPWAKQRWDEEGWRVKFETFSLDDDFYRVVQAYKAMVLAQLWQTYPDGTDWNVAIENVPLFRRKLDDETELRERINPPVLLDSHLQKSLEDAPQAIFHAGQTTISAWLERIERMEGFPISPRTHQPLKVTRGHRFRHTLGTDLSNAGMSEWAMARALMHKGTQTVRKYRQVSAELLALIDAKMTDHLTLVVNAFTGIIVTDRTSAKNGELADRLIEDLAVCGADAACHLDAPFTCYACGKFQPLLDADHSSVLERLERRREQTIATDKTTGVLWDRAILACRKVILDCEAMRQSSSSGKTEE